MVNHSTTMQESGGPRSRFHSFFDIPACIVDTAQVFPLPRLVKIYEEKCKISMELQLTVEKISQEYCLLENF